MEFLEKLVGQNYIDRPFVALVSPSIRELMSDSWPRINGLLKRLGARAIHAVDAGVAEFALRSAEQASRRGPGIHILSACPMAGRFIESKYAAFSDRMLAVSSPMAIQARTAFVAAGISDRGWALALTPCAYKRLEMAEAGFDFRVVELRDFIAALEQLDYSLDEEVPLPYDVIPASLDSHCAIAEAVATHARNIGRDAQTVKLDGLNAAISFFDELSSCKADRSKRDDMLFIELSFCEGGCSSAPQKDTGKRAK